MLFKTLRGLAACNIPPYINPHTTTNRASHSNYFHVQIPHSDTYRFSIYPRTARIWNLLPAALIHAPSIEVFKANLRKDFVDSRMDMVPRRGHYDQPKLGSPSSVTIVGPVFRGPTLPPCT